MTQRDARKAEVKARNVALGTIGLLVALGLILGMRLAGFSSIGFGQWGLAVAITLAVQALLWCIARFGWDRHLPGDPHYVFTPMLGTILLLGLFMYLAPDLRVLLLLGWFVALLFLAGLAGFVEVVVVSLQMAAVFVVVTELLRRQGHPMNLGFDAAVAGMMLVLSIFAGVVFERLRRDRNEAIELRRKLAALALTDALTELPNRRHFEQRLAVELARVDRYGGHCTIAMLDVDGFKAYNDALGHPAGDDALRQLAELMQEALRRHDLVARYGGEEFAAIMLAASPEQAFQAVDRLRQAVEEHDFADGAADDVPAITISGGLATYPDDADTMETLLRQADKALYAAKRAGKNRVMRAG